MRAGELALSFTSCSIWESGLAPQLNSTVAGPGGVSEGELALRACKWENWYCPLVACSNGSASQSSAGELALVARMLESWQVDQFSYHSGRDPEL